MGRRCGRQWPRSSKSGGFTLVEAVLGVALLASLMTGLLIAEGRTRIQAAHAQRRLAAVRVADELIAGWWKDYRNFPRSGDGAAGNDWKWRIEPANDQPPAGLAAEVVAIKVFAADRQDDKPVVQVEVLLPSQEYESSSVNPD